MPRYYTPAQIAAAQSSHHTELYLFEADFPVGIKRYSTAPVRLTADFYDPGTLGIGWTGGIDPSWVGEVRDTELREATGLKLALPGLSPALIAEAMLYPVQGRRITVWVALLDPNAGYPLIGSPVPEWEGLLDVVYPEDRPSEGGMQRLLVIEAETEEARFLRSNVRRYTDTDHLTRYPTDTICRWTQQTERTVVWPTAAGLRG